MKANWNELINKPKWWDEVTNKSEDSCTYDLDDTSKTITINSSQGSYEEWMYNPNLPPRTNTIPDQGLGTITRIDAGTLSFNTMSTINQVDNEEIFNPLPDDYKPPKYKYFPEDSVEIYEITAEALDAGAGRVSRIIPIGGSICRDSCTNIYTVIIYTLTTRKDIRIELKYSEELIYDIIRQSFEADNTASMLEDLFYEDIYIALLAEFQKVFNDEKYS